MQYDFRTSQLWKRTLALVDGDNQTSVDLLRTSFEVVRENIAHLLSLVQQQFPGYTMHDISHADALWDMTDIILKDSKIDLNPLEGYVLGCSFLFHDLGMSPAIYENRLSLENSDLWKDSYSFFRKKGLAEIDARRNADEETIRKMHSENAKLLPIKCFKENETNTFHLIENQSLRASLGDIIGKIASSHGISIEKLDSLFSKGIIKINGFPSKWEVNPIKLACILRIADAIHITSDRTPFVIWATCCFNEESRRHWTFQSKMNKPIIDGGRLIFNSSSAFKKSERESWWLCYDTLKMINQELLDVDALLARHNIPSLGTWCVKNIDSPRSMAKLIDVDGWTPVDSQMKVSNVSGLIRSLGGEALYGNNDYAPLRELVQNASDAIRARRKLDHNDDSWGDIHITVKDENEGTTVEVEDNGIGMSENVLIGPFLDFGSSFWHSSLMRTELPGLESLDFESTGHFGIGFFSVFMWGDEVSVTTCRYNEDRAKTKILEFHSGADSRPLLRIAEKNEQLKDGGTKICVRLKRKWPKKSPWDAEEPLESYLSRLFCCMDCNVFLAIGVSNCKKIISANDWINMDSFKFLKRVYGVHRDEMFDVDDEYLEKVSKRVRLIHDENGHIRGRGTIGTLLNGMLNVGGIYANKASYFAGVLLANCDVAARDSAYPVISEETMKQWLQEQRELLLTDPLWENETADLNIAALLYSAGVETTSIPIAYYRDKPVNYEQIKAIVKETNFDQYFVFEKVSPRDIRKRRIIYKDNVFLTHAGTPFISANYKNLIRGKSLLLDIFPSPKERGSLRHAIAEACAEVWRENVNDIEIVETPENQLYEIVGTYEGEPIQEECSLIITKSKIQQNECAASVKK